MRRLAILSIAIAYPPTTCAANGPAPFPSSGELATFATSTSHISPGSPVTVTSELLETLTVAAQRTPCPGPPQVWQREGATSSSYQHTLFCLSWDALGSGELASARGELSTEVFLRVSGGVEMGGIADRDGQATPPSERTGSGVSTPSILSQPSTGSEGTLLPSTSSRPSSQDAHPPQPQTTSSLLPTINIPALETCFHPPSPSPSPSPSSSPPPNCNALLTHISTCHDTLGPWTDPYDSAQSAAFQACMCQTSATTRFGPEGEVWRNFSACAECLTAGEEGGAGVEFGKMTEEWGRIENFCASQNPVAYLFLLRLVGWLGSLHPGGKLDQPPLSGDVMGIGSLGPKFTTTAPLVNLAWGASAPSDGSLRDVRPSLTTWTLASNFAGSQSVRLVTSFVTWLPTATASRTTVDPRTASSSAAARISEELGAALSSMAADAGGQGGPSGKCIGGCPDKSQAVGNALSLSLILVTLGTVLGVLLVV
ncbi:hypothetical protein KC343_g15143 [Hortaea werneckii]|nr:hypothetical protein KC317_g15201 [Hortaea werneckii]KAI7596667.1 hypothetical protein KC346_g15044 [Hortaea werneckii]KAI7601752.1 hypothetical protein KC343_g15143 [Hortaea werneckii]KAI7637904.1 hypothetical protein KC319_g14904 [Hortaea werneckii]KAI7678005.1 hypothetical protein KC322_g15037 [Hortaea werneckii]